MERIDSNADGYITTDELKAWIKRVQKRYVYENVAKVWTDYDLNKDNKISWDEYKQATYGYYLGKNTGNRQHTGDSSLILFYYYPTFHPLSQPGGV